MNKKFKIIIAIVILVFGSFLYGLLVGHYNVFPFYQIIGLRNNVYDLIGVEYEPKTESVKILQNVEVFETALQRLLLKKVPIYFDKKIERSGAMGNADYKVFINANPDNEEKELIQVYDLKYIFQYETDTLRVPMNYEKLLTSTLVNLEDFDLFRYRVSDLFIEENTAGSHTLYASHHAYEEDENCISFNISKIIVSFEENVLTKESDWQNIFKAEPCVYPEKNVGYANPFPGHMESGKIIEYDDRRLLVSVGTFSDDPNLYDSLPMDESSSFGKILLIDKSTGESRIFAKGIRNTQGMVKASNGLIWSTDHGPQGGDELNILREGNNYGWPKEIYGINYGNRKWPHSEDQGRHRKYDKPAFVWIPSIAPTGIIQIHGEKFKLWNQDFLIGSLSGRVLSRIRVVNDDRVIYNEAIQIQERIRDLLTLPDNRIVLLLDDSSLLIIDDGGPIYEEMSEDVHSRIASLELFDELVGNIKNFDSKEVVSTANTIFAQNCAPCHSLNETNTIGPHLNNLFAREVGELTDYNYSHTLRTSEKKWTPDLLRSYLLEPEEQFPNSSMLPLFLTPEEADSIIVFLQNN